MNEQAGRTERWLLHWVFSSFGVCMGEGWNSVLLMKARDLRAPAKSRSTAGNSWACFPVLTTPLCLITVYKLLLYQELIPCWCRSLLTLDSFAAVCQAFSCSIALPFCKYSTTAAAAMPFGSQGCAQVQNLSCFSAMLCWRSSASVREVGVLLLACSSGSQLDPATGLVAESLCDAFICFSS